MSENQAAPLTAKWLGQLRVESIADETPSVRTFRLRASGDGPLPFTFVPGQFLNVAFGIGGARMNRSYSIRTHELLKRWFSRTLIVHIILSVAMYALLAAHIASGIYFGLRWLL